MNIPIGQTFRKQRPVEVRFAGWFKKKPVITQQAEPKPAPPSSKKENEEDKLQEPVPQPKKARRGLLWGLILAATALAVGPPIVKSFLPPKPVPAIGKTDPLPADLNNLIFLNAKEVLREVDQIQGIQVQVVKELGGFAWRLEMKNHMTRFYVPDPKQDGFDQLRDAIREKGIHPAIHEDNDTLYGVLNLLLFAIPAVWLGSIVVKNMRNGGMSGPAGLLNGNRFQQIVDRPQETLEDVAGVPEVIDEIRHDVIEVFKNPDNKLGAKLPKGILLTGPPGTGKTLLARAIAGELNRPFFRLSGSDFVEMFVGVGAQRVRQLFDEAKKNAPSIIFIDEIDAVGKKRGSNTGMSGHDEREQTLNAILSEMDGFEAKNNVLVIAATNRMETLDGALIRPGRFDRKYTVSPPMTPQGREEILKIHLKNVKLGEDVDSGFLSRRFWPGATGAQIKKVVNDAALLAVRRNHDAVSRQDFLDAIEKESYGIAKKDVSYGAEDKRRVALHEAALGHAAMAWALGLPVQFITIVPRHLQGETSGTALGMMGLDPESMPKYHQTRAFLEKMVQVIMAGRAAEEVTYGKPGISSGASDDWAKANKVLKSAIEEGMLYPDSYGHVVLQSNPEFSFDSPNSDAQKAKGEQVRNQLMKELYDVVVAFTQAIPPEVRDEILKQVEAEETLNDPKRIEAMFESPSIKDNLKKRGYQSWQDLWAQSTEGVRAKRTIQ